MSRTFRMIDGCPCPAEVAPQVYMVLRQAGQTASSIYRGQDAAALLHRHGKSTQAELYELFREGKGFPANPPGRSEHELRSDGVGKAGPPGRVLPDWQVGVDSGTNTAASRDAITQAAAHFGWEVAHNYSSGVEAHHWSFKWPPRPRSAWQRARIAWLNARLPRS